MDQELVRVVARNRFAELLHSPSCRWMGGDIEVQNASVSDLHHHEHIQHSEASCNGDQEIAGHQCLGVIPNEGAPTQRGISPWSAIARALGQYALTVRGDTKTLSFSASSSATRSSPQAGFTHHLHNEPANILPETRPFLLVTSISRTV